MTTAGWIRSVVLWCCGDDYESLEIIIDDTNKKAAEERRPPVSRESIVDALERLVSEGLLDSYELSPEAPHGRKIPFSRDTVEKLWFYPTPRGLSLIKAYVENTQAPN